MTVKLILLKSGEDIIADVTEMIVGENEDKKSLDIFFDKACVVKLKEGQEPTEKKSAFQVSMFPWMPLSADSHIPVPSDWVVTMVEPKEKLKQMYLEDVLGNGKIVKVVTLMSQQLLISEIEEVAATVPGEPDCKLINPFIIKDELVLEPWLLKVTKDDIFMLSSDKILTLVEPTPTLLEKYLDLTKE